MTQNKKIIKDEIIQYITQQKRDMSRLKPLIYYKEVIQPLRKANIDITEFQKEVSKIIKECKDFRRKVYKENSINQHYKEYKQCKDIISFAEMWFY